MARSNDVGLNVESMGDSADQVERAGGEIAPRAGSTFGEAAPGASGMSSAATSEQAVDENRPVDVVSVEGMNGIDAPRFQPNVLQRGYVIGDATHAAETTADLGPVGEAEWNEEESLKTAATASADIRSFSDT